MAAQASDARAVEDPLARALGFLAEVTRTFSQDLADCQRLLDTIARRLAEVLADACAISLLSEDGETLQFVARHCPDAEMVRLLEEHLPAQPLRVADEHLAQGVLTSAAPFLAPRYRPEEMRTVVAGWSDTLASALGIHSGLLVPMRLYGRAIGVISLGRYKRDSPPFDARDQELAQLLGDHAALALGAARACAAEREARLAAERARAEGEALQRGLLERTAELTEKNRELAAAEQRSFALLENAPIAIAVSTLDGTVLEVNRAWEQLTGVARERALGRTVADFAPPPLRDSRKADFEEAVAHGGGPVPALPLLRADGSVSMLEVTRTVLELAGGRRVLSIARDITERLRLEQQLRETRLLAEREQRDYREALQRAAFEETMAEERARRRLAVELHDGVGQALALAQLKLGSIDALPPCPLRASIRAAHALIAQAVADTRSLTFELSPPVLYDLGLAAALDWLAEDLEKRLGQRVEVVGDIAGLALEETTAAVVFRAVRELLMNAYKHALTSEARVELRRVGELLEVRVSDRGVGFDSQAASVWSASRGFGLFSVREQIHRLGGALELTSAPGQGTQVAIRVPLERPPPAAAPG